MENQRILFSRIGESVPAGILIRQQFGESRARIESAIAVIADRRQTCSSRRYATCATARSLGRMHHDRIG
jgi:hypothetical protein